MIEPAEEILRKILYNEKALQANLAGSLRRKMEVVGNINLVVSSSNFWNPITKKAELNDPAFPENIVFLPVQKHR